MKTRNPGDSALVYSTGQGKTCPTCREPIAQCTCLKKNLIPEGDGIVRVGRETKGRKGKSVTVISGVPLDSNGLRGLAKHLKQQCGTGGTVKEGIIEIQGDHREALIEELKKQGYIVKRSGG